MNKRNPQVTDRPELVAPAQRTRAASRWRPRRILIAESDRDAAALETEDRAQGCRQICRHGSGFDLVLLEPALPGAVRLARALRLQRPLLPIVCVSIYPAGLLPESELLVLAPLAYLVKPCVRSPSSRRF